MQTESKPTELTSTMLRRKTIMPSKQQTTQVVEELEVVQQELALLKGFRDLVSEGIGYYFGSKAVSSEAGDDVEVIAKRKEVTTLRKEISNSIPTWIQSADVKTYEAKIAEHTEARKGLSAVMKPFTERKKPLDKAWRYCIGVAFPDALKELGAPVNPRFKLSDWIKEATAKKKK